MHNFCWPKLFKPKKASVDFGKHFLVHFFRSTRRLLVRLGSLNSMCAESAKFDQIIGSLPDTRRRLSLCNELKNLCYCHALSSFHSESIGLFQLSVLFDEFTCFWRDAFLVALIAIIPLPTSFFLSVHFLRQSLVEQQFFSLIDFQIFFC